MYLQMRNNSFWGRYLDGSERRNIEIQTYILKKNIPNTGVKMIRFINLGSLLLWETVKYFCIPDMKNVVVKPL
jgi:hypothetical protein